ncbi:DUF6000 family protein [Streptomyces caniscabiei]|nr:DUF6000 family protein [Streptomyces caniscabiei]MDX3514945.1 DUF6000 family protein [Streptomyces caniscabiei]MDX3724198.1 DUF6000 family protein [Streptomyces caniscabiei]WEO25137.1 DUF6000 family protein [Streptomyces caniscabiei]
MVERRWRRELRGSRVGHVPVMTPEETVRWNAVKRYVQPRADRRSIGRYGELLSGRFLRYEGATRRRFLRPLLADASSITDADLEALLFEGWRPRLTAAWLIGIARRTSYRARLGELLLASETVYAGLGYCFALARFSTPEDAEILAAYLDRYLPRTDLRYDQPLAMGALLYVDSRLGTAHAAPYTAPGGLYQRWVDVVVHETDRPAYAPDQERIAMTRLCDFADGWTTSG